MIDPIIAWVVETGIRRSVPIRIQAVAPISAFRTKSDPGVVRRRLWGVKMENNLPAINIADRLPIPLKMPPQSRAL